MPVGGTDAACVRLATERDLDPLIDTVVAAFAHDPAWVYILGPTTSAVRRAFAHALVWPRILAQTAWVSDDCAAVATWDRRSTTQHDDHDHAAAWADFQAAASNDIEVRLHAYEAAMATVEPPRPYWYLEVLATRPDRHGQGLATTVMQPGLAAADADRWPCWLETCSDTNRNYYRRRGFDASRPFDVPDGPRFWWLGRAQIDGSRVATPR